MNLLSLGDSLDESLTSSHGNMLSEDVLLDKEQFAVCIAALGISDLDQFKNYLTVQKYIDDLDLAKFLNQAYNNPTAMWQAALPYLDHSPNDLHSMLSGSQSSRLTDYFRAVKNLLWERGVRSFNMGFSNTFSSTGYGDIDNVLQDIKSYQNSASLWKISAMSNAYKALNKLFPMGYSGTGDKQVRSCVDKFLSAFSQGKLDCIPRGSLKFPKEMGIVLPHTLPPQEWIARLLTDLFRKLCGFDRLFLVFRRENADVTRFDTDQSDYILADFDDYPSPYTLDHHPSLNEDQYDEDGKWNWRNVVKSNLKLAAATDHDQLDQLNEVVDASLTAHAEEEYSTFGFVFGDDYVVTDNSNPKNLFIRIFRRGCSKMDEVKQNPGYIHIISAAIAQTVSSSDYVKVLLADYNSVLLIPTDFWERLGRSPTAVRPYGTVVPKIDLAGIRLIAFLSQFALTHQFLSALQAGKPFDIDGAIDRMINTVVGSSALRALQGWKSTDNITKEKFLTSMFQSVRAASYGLAATAERNKIGVRTQRQVNQNLGFIQFVDDDLPEENDEVNHDFIASLVGLNRTSAPSRNTQTSNQDVSNQDDVHTSVSFTESSVI